MKDFREVLNSDRVFVFDGAVGTRLYDKGVYINRSYDWGSSSPFAVKSALALSFFRSCAPNRE